MPQILIVIDSYEGLREAQTLTNLEACFKIFRVMGRHLVFP